MGRRLFHFLLRDAVVVGHGRRQYLLYSTHQIARTERFGHIPVAAIRMMHIAGHEQYAETRINFQHRIIPHPPISSHSSPAL
jgi:hypothetical protein